MENVLEYIAGRDYGEVVITPEEALGILEQNMYYGQRKVRFEQVEVYAREMKFGRWSSKRSVIKFTKVKNDLYLTDGQHRLLALIEYGKPLVFVFVVENVETERDLAVAYDSIDDGMNRKLGDSALFVVGGKQLGISSVLSKYSATAIKVIYQGFTARSEKYSKIQQWNWVKDWSDQIITFQDELYEDSVMKNRSRSSPVMAFALLTLKYRKSKAIEFWKKVFTGEMLRVNDPRKRLYDFFNDTTIKDMDTGRTNWIQYGLYINVAWEAFLENRDYRVSIRVRNIMEKPLQIMGTPYDTSQDGYGINAIALRRNEAYIGKMKREIEISDMLYDM